MSDIDKARRAKALRDQGKSGNQVAHALLVPYENEKTSARTLISMGYIADLQERLKASGHYSGAVDGLFWNKTHAAFMRVIEDTQCPPTLPDGSSQEVRSPTSMTLAERALSWCLSEADHWGDKQVSESRLYDYLLGCRRDDGDGDPSNDDALGKWLARKELATPGRDFSFCAAAQGFAEDRASLPGDVLPPWRAGAIELKRDAEEGLRPSERWLPLAELIDGQETPPPGALAIYQNTASSWRGHAERIVTADATGYRAVGANENNGRWVVDKTPVRYADAGRADGVQRLRLLGFVVPV